MRTKLSLGFDFLGPQAVKNIAEPVPAWRVVLEGSAEDAAASNPLPERERIASEHARGRVRGALPPANRSSCGRSATRVRRFRRQRLKRRAAFAAVPIAIVFAVNMLTYTDTIWFQWPTLGILAVFACARRGASAVASPSPVFGRLARPGEVALFVNMRWEHARL